MVWTITEKRQNKFSPQCLALCSSPQVPQAILPAVATFQHPLPLLCSPAAGYLVIKLVSSFILPPVLALNRSSLFSSKETLAKEHISSFPFSSPFPAPDLSPPSSSLRHLMLPSALALSLLTLPLASGFPPHSPGTF